MSRRAKRIWTGGASAGAVTTFLLATLSWGLESFRCENADEARLHTVRCDGPRGHGWVLAQGWLVFIGGLALLAGIGWALRKASFRPLAAGASFAVAVFAAVFLIGDIHLASTPMPRLSGMRVLDRRCPDLCVAGLRVAFTNDRSAPLAFEFGPLPNLAASQRGHQYRTEVITRAGATPNAGLINFAPGRHVVRVDLLERTYTDRPYVEHPEPLRPGRYSLDITAIVQSDPGDESDFPPEVDHEFTILPDSRGS